MLAITMVLLALAIPKPGIADSSGKLTEARQRLDELDYDAALRVLQDALATGKSSPVQMRSIYRMLGEVHAALGHTQEAERFFRSWLALEPGATLPGGISPKIARPFAAARTYMGGHEPLDARCTADTERTAVVVQVVSDPLGLVRGAQARYRTASGAERKVETTGRGEITLILPIEQRAEVVCAAIDEHGNHLIETGSWDEPLVLELAAAPESVAVDKVEPPPPPRTQSRSLFGRWYVWSTVALAAGGAGGYFALQAQADQEELATMQQNSSMYQYSEVQAVEQRGQRNALMANISFGVAGVGAVIAVVTILRSGSDEPPAVAVTPLIATDGGGVLVRARF